MNKPIQGEGCFKSVFKYLKLKLLTFVKNNIRIRSKVFEWNYLMNIHTVNSPAKNFLIRGNENAKFIRENESFDTIRTATKKTTCFSELFSPLKHDHQSIFNQDYTRASLAIFLFLKIVLIVSFYSFIRGLSKIPW